MGSASTSYGPPAADELEVLADIDSQAFNVPIEDTRTWLQAAGPANLRVFRRGRRIASSLVFIPMGQFFGGRSVPMMGVAGVATNPAQRGSGAATALMRAAALELSGAGWPLSALYPAVQPVYRRAGYEQAGARSRISAPPRSLGLSDRSLAVRPFVPDDRGLVEAAYRELAAAKSGWLDRGRYVWERVLRPRGEPTRGFLVEEDGRLTGWAFLLQRRLDRGHYRLEATDLQACTPRAASRLATFLADHGALAPEVVWFGAAEDPLLLLAPEMEAKVEQYAVWMLRILDPARALEGRGYLPGLSAELHLEVSDEIVPRCAGRFVLEIAGGAGRLRSGGEGRVRAHARGLAALYSGHRSAETLAITGLVEGSAEDLKVATAVFAGPAPSMADMF